MLSPTAPPPMPEAMPSLPPASPTPPSMPPPLPPPDAWDQRRLPIDLELVNARVELALGILLCLVAPAAYVARKRGCSCLKGGGRARLDPGGRGAEMHAHGFDRPTGRVSPASSSASASRA